MIGGFGRSLSPLSTVVEVESVVELVSFSSALSSVEQDTAVKLTKATKLRARIDFFILVKFFNRCVIYFLIVTNKNFMICL